MPQKADVVCCPMFPLCSHRRTSEIMSWAASKTEGTCPPVEPRLDATPLASRRRAMPGPDTRALAKASM
eukprot:6550909-Pyramimonas_sp.AAC.1